MLEMVKLVSPVSSNVVIDQTKVLCSFGILRVSITGQPPENSGDHMEKSASLHTMVG